MANEVIYSRFKVNNYGVSPIKKKIDKVKNITETMFQNHFINCWEKRSNGNKKKNKKNVFGSGKWIKSNANKLVNPKWYKDTCTLWQKQQPTVFYKQWCSWKFCKTHRKSLVPGCLFLKIFLWKRDSDTGVFLWFLRNF